MNTETAAFRFPKFLREYPLVNLVEPPQLHPDSQVRALDVRREDPVVLEL